MTNILTVNKCGKVFKVINDNQTFWSEYVEDKWESSFFESICSEKYKKQVFLDVGSSNGCISFFASFIFKKVLAIDPEIKFYDLLKKNLELNPAIKNVQPIHAALGVDNKIIKFEPNDHFNIIMFNSNKNYDVNIFSLDHLLKNFIKNQKFFLKIDIEGYEFHLLNNKKFMSIIKEKKPDIYIGIHLGFSSLYKYKKLKIKFFQKFINLEKTFKEYFLIFNLIKNYSIIMVNGKKVSKFFFLSFRYYRKNVNIFLKN